jgi:hypothetical protein
MYKWVHFSKVNMAKLFPETAFVEMALSFQTSCTVIASAVLSCIYNNSLWNENHPTNKRFKLGGVQAYDRLSVYILRQYITIRHNLLYKAWADRPVYKMQNKIKKCFKSVKKNKQLRTYEGHLRSSWTGGSAPLLCKGRRWLLCQVVVVG